jgi:cell division septation protein DedD
MRLVPTVALVAILVVVFAGTASTSKATSGNELYKLLSSKSPYSRRVGQAYILGVVDTTHSLNRVWRLPVRWIIPPEVTNGEIFEAVKEFFEQNPEERDKTAYTSVIAALGSAFPPNK